MGERDGTGGTRNDSVPMCVGVDGTRRRWVAVALGADGTFASALLVDRLDQVLAAFDRAEAFAVDVPLGLPSEGPRAADLEAKMLLGPRRSTIFPVPPLPVLQAPNYATARAKAVELTGRSISAQSYALRHNILEADTLRSDGRVYEAHPELTFRALAGRVLMSHKRTWNGASERREALATVGIELPEHLEGAGDSPIDDVLDAAACAWSARRIVLGEAECVPAEPVVDDFGRRVAIWF